MEHIDELLEQATPDFARRDQLRSLFAEWQQVKISLGRRELLLHIPLIVREDSEEAGTRVTPSWALITASDPLELEQIREELAEAGVPVMGESPPRGGEDPAEA